MDGVSKRMYRVLILKLLIQKKLLIYLNKCKLQKQFTKVLYNLLKYIFIERAYYNYAGHIRQMGGGSA